jgi:hypothetical protein
VQFPRRCSQIRLRTLVILIAIVAIGQGGVRWMERRAREFRRLAMEYRDMAKLDEISAAVTGGQQFARIGAYRRFLQRKYEYASTHPWLPVQPDPPFQK